MGLGSRVEGVREVEGRPVHLVHRELERNLVQGFAFRVWGLRSGGWGLGSRLSGLGFRV